MAGSKSLYLENLTLDLFLGGNGSTYTSPTILYIALSTSPFSAALTGTTLVEVTGGGYTRVAFTNSSTNWPAASAGLKSNAVVFTFPAATADWGTVQSFYILGASTNGVAYYGGDLTTARPIHAGDSASFAIGSLTFTET